MSTNITYFLHMWRTDTLQDDVTWRAYNFEAAVKPRHIRRALKQLGLEYAGELGVQHFKALYEIGDAEPVNAILGLWWLWRARSLGGRPRVPLRSKELLPQPGSGLPPPQATEIGPGGGGQSGA